MASPKDERSTGKPSRPVEAPRADHDAIPGEEALDRAEELAEEEEEQEEHLAEADDAPGEGEPPAGGGNGADLENKLKELEDKLKQQRWDLDNLTKMYNNSRSDLTELKDLIDQLKQILSRYEAALPEIRRKTEDFHKYSQKKTEMIETAVKAHKSQIDGIIKAVDKNITRLQAIVNHHRKILDQEVTAHQEAVTTHEEKDAQFNALRTRQKSIEDRQKGLDEKRRRIEAEEEECRYAVMYFLMNEFNLTMKQTANDTIPVGDLKQAIYDAWRELDTATDNLRERERKLEITRKVLADAEVNLARAQDSRRDDIIKRLGEIEF